MGVEFWNGTESTPTLALPLQGGGNVVQCSRHSKISYFSTHVQTAINGDVGTRNESRIV
jgi:hypothetical protein